MNHFGNSKRRSPNRFNNSRDKFDKQSQGSSILGSNKVLTNNEIESSKRSVDSIKSELNRAFNKKFGKNEQSIPGTIETEEDLKGVGSPMNDPKHLQKQFSKATKNQKAIQERYKDLW